MTIHLLDVNVLLAVHDTLHPFHRYAYGWFERNQGGGWASCPITENGFVRIASNPKYHGPSQEPWYCAQMLARTCNAIAHVFWHDDISARDFLEKNQSLTFKQFPDIYLLALAIEHGGKLATLDRRIPAAAIPGGVDALEVIPS